MISIILLTGREGVGKSTVAEYLCSHHDYEELSFAGTLRTAATTMWNDIVKMFEYSDVIPYGPSITVKDTQDQSTKNNPIHLPIVELGSATHLTMADGRTFTPRVLLQWFGTDIMRNLVADDIWVHSTLAQLRKRVAAGQTRFVISDCRFENELTAVRSFVGELDGGSCKLVRLLPGNTSIAELEAMKTTALSAHPSARGWVTLPADIEIKNPFDSDTIHTWLASVAEHIC